MLFYTGALHYIVDNRRLNYYTRQKAEMIAFIDTQWLV